MTLNDTRYLERLIGRDALETLMQTYGGLVLRIPKRPPSSGPLRDLPEPAQKALCTYAGGTMIYIPKDEKRDRAARNAAIRAAYAGGESVQSIARRYRLTERWVYEILNRPD
ncbi:MAG: Mor transcription activator family protein [Halothiobacillaceae bacterium]